MPQFREEVNSPFEIPRANILGVGISAVNMGITLGVIDTWIQQCQPHYICVTGVHGVIESQRDEALRRIHNSAGLVTPDGMPLVWLSRLKGFHQVKRGYGPDLMLALCDHSVECGYRHFFYGGAEGVPELLVANLQQRFPGLVVTGTHSPPFRSLTSEEDAQVVQIPHHGGKISEEFRDSFQNKIFIVSTGENDWGFPWPGELEKLKGRIYRTDKVGTVVVQTDGREVEVKTVHHDAL